MQNDILNSDEVYEAIYIARKIDILNNKINILKQPAVNAIHRIMKVTNIANNYDMDKYINKFKTHRLDIQAENLYSKLFENEDGSFFNLISKEELHLYHYYNYEVSYNYGLNLAKSINFQNKNILDIGGSSGGLCGGIISKFKTSVCTVYDTSFACGIGLDIRKNNIDKINFIEGNFFNKISINGKYDYIILSNVIHDWNDINTVRIFKNIEPYLKHGAKLIIHEDLLFNNEIMPVDTVIYGLRLCANVPEGRQRTVGELKTLINDALSIDVEVEQVINFGVHSAMILAFNNYNQV